MTALLDTVLDAIRARRDDIEARFGVRVIGVVGSVARGEERPESDVDLVIDVTGRPSLFDLSDVIYELTSVIGRKVDLVDRETMRPEARSYIERDLVVA